MPPTAEHEVPIGFARLDPGVWTWILGEAFGFRAPPYQRAWAHAADIQVPAPGTFHADSVLVFADEAGVPVLVLILEVQRRFDPDKRFAWRLYQAQVSLEFQVTAELVVYCPRSGVAERYRDLLATDGLTAPLRPFLVTPADVPDVADPAAVPPSFAAAAFGVVAHGHDPGAATALARLAAAFSTLGPDQRTTYHDLVLAGLPEELQSTWRKLMSTALKNPFYSEDFRRMWEERVGKGIAEGRAEGLAEGRSASVLTVLSARGIAVPDDIRRRVMETTDLDLLDTWVTTAVSADSLADVFGD